MGCRLPEDLDKLWIPPSRYTMQVYIPSFRTAGNESIDDPIRIKSCLRAENPRANACVTNPRIL